MQSSHSFDLALFPNALLACCWCHASCLWCTHWSAGWCQRTTPTTWHVWYNVSLPSVLLICPRLSSLLHQHPSRLRAEDSSSHQEQTPPHHQETFTFRRSQCSRLRSGITGGGVSVYTGTTTHNPSKMNSCVNTIIRGDCLLKLLSHKKKPLEFSDSINLKPVEKSIKKLKLFHVWEHWGYRAPYTH